MDLEMVPVLLAGLLALAFAGYLARFILNQDAGTEKVKEIAAAIQVGASTFLRNEFRVLAVVTVIVTIIFAFVLDPKPWVGIAYLIGTITSALAGYMGMSIAVRANSRTAIAASTSWAKSLRIAFSGGADFSGMTGSPGLFIDAVLHKAFVSLDEAGTEAAAATAVIMKEEAPSQQAEVTLDRPFIFLIRDIETGAILFVGRVMNPGA